MTGVCAQGGGVLFAPRSHYLLPLPLTCTTYLLLPTSRTTVLTLVSTTTFAKLSLSPPLTCSSQMTELSIMGTTSSIHDITLPHLPHYLTIAAYVISRLILMIVLVTDYVLCFDTPAPPAKHTTSRILRIY